MTSKYIGMTFMDSIYFSTGKITLDKGSREKITSFMGN
jgi:hypothetical protein